MKSANNYNFFNVLAFENQNNHGNLCYITHMNVRKLKSKIHSIQLSLNFINNNLVIGNYITLKITLNVTNICNLKILKII
jgi:hypothetical protein